MDIGEWLEELYAFYGVTATPVVVAAEILLGLTDPVEVARSINRRGLSVGDDVMMSTTPADVADAVEELIGFGFLVAEFSASCAHVSHAYCDEQVLRFALP